MAAGGEVRWPPLGRNRWPLTYAAGPFEEDAREDAFVSRFVCQRHQFAVDDSVASGEGEDACPRDAFRFGAFDKRFPFGRRAALSQATSISAPTNDQNQRQHPTLARSVAVLLFVILS